jgi:hypothetical protein
MSVPNTDVWQRAYREVLGASQQVEWLTKHVELLHSMLTPTQEHALAEHYAEVARVKVQYFRLKSWEVNPNEVRMNFEIQPEDYEPDPGANMVNINEMAHLHLVQTTMSEAFVFIGSCYDPEDGDYFS